MITASDEAVLIQQMEKAELENTEVAGGDEESMQNGVVDTDQDDKENEEEYKHI